MTSPTTFAKEALHKQLSWEQIDPDYLRQLVGLAKIEDLAGAGLARHDTA